MRLFLVRHATPLSKEKNPSRPLSGEGRAEAETVAAFLSDRAGITVQRIFHSGKARAMETAEIIGARLDMIGSLQEVDGLRPNDDPRSWGERISQWDQDIMLIGHLPHLDRLVAFLVCGDADRSVVDLPPAGTVCLERSETDEWAIRWIVAPDILP